jgi:putative ABC transport system permease protein
MLYWQTNVPVGYVFGLGAVMGFVIGSIICYQILFTDVSDHLPQFATLKAIGYPNRYIVGVVVRQGLLLSVLGFIPGSGVAHLLYQQLEAMAGLPMRLTVPRLALVFTLTVAMTVLSGLLAVRRAVAADPAEVFA